MNALMNVQVMVYTLKARQQIREMEFELRRFRRAVNGTGLAGMSGSMDRATASTARYTTATRGATAGNAALTSSFGRAMTMGTKFGNQMQWTGRQLQYNFALPIALAGTWAVNAAMQQEKAMTRVAKVYGDGTQSAQVYKKELEALADNFTALSNKFGVAREDVIAIAGDWAAAGAEAGALARGVRLTMEAMVLGEIEAATATKALIAIQAQYGYNTTQLTKVIADLNVVENETGTTMNDLIQSMSRSAAVARQVGVDHKHLAALTSALVPATGSATMAGNGLKTMLTRLMAPTNEAADAMKEMGIEIYDTSWQSLSATERLEKMAKSYQTLKEGQRIYISDLVAGKWQISKWSQLMADLTSENGYYRKSLKATNDEAKVFQQYQSELGAVLASNPQKFKQAGQIIRNSLADAIIPLLPYIVFLAQKVANLAQAFANMNPYAQGVVLALLSFLLVFGPLLRYMGSSLTLFATLGDALRWVGAKFLGLGGEAAAGSAATQAAMSNTTAATAGHARAQVGIWTKAGQAMNSVWSATWGGIVAQNHAFGKTMLGQHLINNARNRAAQARSNRLRVNEEAVTGTQILNWWKAFWARFRSGQAASDASTAASSKAANTAQSTDAAATTGFLTRIWAQYFAGRGTMATVVYEGILVEEAAFGAAMRASASLTTGYMWAAWAAYYTAITTGQAQLTTGRLAIESAGAAKSTGATVAHITTLQALWFKYWMQHIAATVAAGEAWVVKELQAGSAVTAARAATMRSLVVITAEQYAAIAATETAANSRRLALEGAFGTTLVAGAGARSGAMLAIEAGYQGASVSRWAAFRAWLLGGEAGWGAKWVALRQRALGTAIVAEHNFRTKSRAGWAALTNWITSITSRGDAAMNATHSTALAVRQGAEVAHHTRSRTNWAFYYGWLRGNDVVNSNAQVAIRAKGLLAVSGAESTFRSRSVALWTAYRSGELARESAATSKEVAIRSTGLQIQEGIIVGHYGRMRALGSAFRAWQTAEEVGWAVTQNSIAAGANATRESQDAGFRARAKAAWAAYHASRVAQDAAAASRRVAIESGTQATETTRTSAFLSGMRARWGAAWAWISAGHQAWMIRMAAIGQVGHVRMAAYESAALTASRARWSAYFLSLAVMQKGAAARMVATDAAMKAKMLGGKFFRVGPLLWLSVILAIIGIVYHFRDEIKEIFSDIQDWVARTFVSWVPFFQKLNNKIVDAFWRLPKGVRDAMLAVVRIIKAAAEAVYDLFSYLNPFARHSPSLVESVEGGMDRVAKAYARVGNVGAIFAKAVGDLARFKAAAAALGRDEWADARADVAAAFPSMLPMFKVLISDLGQLNTVLAQQESAVNAQKVVVEGWEVALDAANAALDEQQLKLDAAKTHLDALTSTYDTHKSSLEAYASAPLKGMGAMEDKIFDNEMAQKKLRLEMLKWEDANGSIDSVRDRLGLLQGDIETARGEAADLRQAGAGSDILGPIEAEIAAMEAQYKATEKAMQDSPISAMQKELEALQRQGEILDLEKSIEFDPLTRAIQKLADTQEELTYDEVIQGINRERAAMADLEPQIEAATKAVEQQEAAVKQATTARDQIAAVYDVEKNKLEGLNDEYQKTAELIRDIEQALNDMASASSKVLSDAKSAAGELTTQDKFDAMAAADFPDVGGTAGIGREGDVNDILAETELLTRETAAMFGKIDFLKPVKDAWHRLVNWWNTEAWPFLEPVFGTIGAKVKEQWEKLFDGEGIEMSGIRERFEEIGAWIQEKIEMVRGAVAGIWRLLGDDIIQTFQEAKKSLVKAFGDIGREVEKYSDLWEPLKEAAEEIWTLIKGIFLLYVGAIILIWKTMWSVLSHIIGPILDTISDTIENALQIIRGIIQVILAVINGDWELALKGIGNIVAGFVDLIWDLFKGFGRILFGIVRGVVEGVFGFFQWLYRETIGKSVNPLVKDTQNALGGIWGNVKGALNGFIRGMASVFNAIGESIAWGINIGISAINGLIGALNWVGKNVPGLSFEISTIGKFEYKKYTPPQFATGGKLPSSSVGEGFVTNQARAIVGEGGRHPEYVIPTDPKHRHNALRLYGELGQAIGGWGFEIPNINPVDAVKSGVGKVADVAGDVGGFIRRNAVMVAAAPFLKTFDSLMKSMPSKPRPIKEMIMAAKNNVYNWLKGVDEKLPTTPPPGTIGNELISGSGWSAIENWLRNASDPTRTITSTFRRGDSGYHGRGMAVDYSTQHRNGGYNDAGLRRIFDALLPAAGSLAELILAGAPFNIKDGRKVAGYAWGEPGQPGNHWNHVHAALKQNLPIQTSTRGGFQEYAKGGIAHSATLGVFGEAGSEILSPLAPLWARFDKLDKKMELLPQGGGDTIINLYGDLSFPNISTGDDAEAFITNLETMARR